MKKLLAVILATVFITSACSGNAGSSAATSAAGTEAPASQAAGTALNASTGSGEKQKVEFWFSSADQVSNTVYQSLFDAYNATSDQYEFVYTGFPSADFPDKFTMAIATGTMPDVVSLGFSNIMTYAEQGALLPINDYFNAWEESKNIIPGVVSSLVGLGGGNQYGYPHGYNQDMSWYNKILFEENNITAPVTQSEFLNYCEQFADSDKGNYFFSLRSVKPYDNLLGWIFTYADGGGYKGSYFDAEGNSIINQPEFAEALDAYANIYKNNWVSGDSINNGYNEMVAEFGSGTAMYIMHNSGSGVNHESNLGKGNYGGAKALANDLGRYYTSSIQSHVYGVTTCKGEGGDYSGAIALCEYLAGADSARVVAQSLSRIPVNSALYEEDWFKNDEILMLCREMVSDENYIYIENPYWLTSYFNFINNEMTTDFQGLLMGEKTAQEVMDGWAEFLTQEQKDYLASR